MRHRLPLEGWVLIAGALLRMLGLFRPLLGNFSGYQTSNAMMARFFIEHHFANWLYPQVNILTAGKPGYLLLAYPLGSWVAGFLFSCFGGSLDAWGRFQAVLFFIGSSVYLHLLLKILVNEKIARASLFVFSLSPLTLVYGQSFQNEMATVFFSLTFFYYLVRLLSEGRLSHLAAASLSLSLAWVTRPNSLYLLAPAAYLALCFKGSIKPGLKNLCLVFLVASLGLILPSLWYLHIWKVSNSVSNIYSTLFQQLTVRSSFLSPLVFSLGYYRDLFDIVSGMVLTPIGFTLLVISPFLLPWNLRTSGFFLVWCVSFLGSSMLIPRKLIDHEFYLLHFLVPVSPLIGGTFVCLTDLVKQKKSQFAGSLFTAFFILISFAVSLRYAAYPAFKTPREDRNIPWIAEKLREVTEKDQSRLITQGTFSLLYYADRYGWPFVIERSDRISDYAKYTNWEKLSDEQRKIRNEALKDPIHNLEYLREYGKATHFVVTHPDDFYRHPDFAKYLLRRYKLIYQKRGVCLIFDLEVSAGASRMPLRETLA